MRSGPRPVVFVCAAISEQGNLLTKVIAASSQDEAGKIFSEHYGVSAQEVLGPFFKKRHQVLEVTRELKFTNQSKKAVYNGWLVNAFLLKEPENQAYLVFIKREDGKPLPIPKGNITVPLSDLRFI